MFCSVETGFLVYDESGALGHLRSQKTRPLQKCGADKTARALRFSQHSPCKNLGSWEKGERPLFPEKTGLVLKFG